MQPSSRQNQILAEAEALLRRVDKPLWAAAFGGLSNAIDEGKVEPQDLEKLIHTVNLALMFTHKVLTKAKAEPKQASGLLTMWSDLPALWDANFSRMYKTWYPLVEVILKRLKVLGVSVAVAPATYISKPEAADQTYVDILHDASTLDNNLRLMFIESENPDTVYAAEVLDQDGVSALLAQYPVSHFRVNPAQAEMVPFGEFWVYNVGSKRIFRTDGYVASTDLSALQVLQSGELLPRMASLRTGSVIRMTFSLRAMQDPTFRDFLRDLGGVPASTVSWDIPIYEEKDVDEAMGKVQKQFGYPVHFYQVIDTPEQNIYASMHGAVPEAQVLDMLSRADVVQAPGFDSISSPDLGDMHEKIASCLDAVDDVEVRHGLERVAAACLVRAHVLVVRPRELRTEGTHFKFDNQKMFGKSARSAALSDTAPRKVVLTQLSHNRFVLASRDSLALDVNHDGTIDATEMATLGLMSGAGGVPDYGDEVQSVCAFGHCPVCSAEGDAEDGDMIVCVDGHSSAASSWLPCDCGPYEEGKVVKASIDIESESEHLLDRAMDIRAGKDVEENVIKALYHVENIKRRAGSRGIASHAAVIADKLRTIQGVLETEGKTGVVRMQAKSIVDVATKLGELVHESMARSKAASVHRGTHRISDRDRNTINDKLRAAGFDGNKSFINQSAGFAKLQNIIGEYNLMTEDMVSEYRITQSSGTLSIQLLWDNGDDTYAPVSNSSVFFQWAPKGDSNRTEVVAYLG